MTRYSTLHEAARHVPLLYTAMRNAVPMDEVILALVDQLDMMKARVMELELICPKKVRGPEGTVWVYRCPDNLIPEPPNGS